MAQNAFDFGSNPSTASRSSKVTQAEPLVERRLCFDIEIANVFELAPGEDLDKYAPFDISVAACVSDRGKSWLWHARDASGRPHAVLDAALAREVLSFLRAAQLAGTQVCAWNGLSFDVRWLGHVAGDVELAATVALDLYDPMFQFLNVKGFPVSLAAVAEGFGIQQKKLMHGSDAPKQWAAGNHDKVLEYVRGDCEITEQVVAKIESTRAVTWRTAKGALRSESIGPLKKVRDVLRDPPPDQSWMSEPKPRESWFAWLGERARVR